MAILLYILLFPMGPSSFETDNLVPDIMQHRKLVNARPGSKWLKSKLGQSNENKQ